MPKMKTNSGAKKRIKRRGDGTLKVHRATRRHLLTKKSPKLKRQSRGTATLRSCEMNNALRMLCDK